MGVTLTRVGGDDAVLARVALGPDGRAAAPLLDGKRLAPGRYRLVFDVAGYFRAKGVALADPPFLDHVPIEFGVADADAHYHVPLLVSPWSYATYRGS
jgi:5-hydroxyisourate hydrolase